MATSNKRTRKKRVRNPFRKGFWKQRWKEALILFAVSAGLYAMSIPYEFVLDDQIVISENTFTKKGIGGLAEIFGNDSFTGYFGEQKDLVAGSRYRPLSIAMFALEYEYAELDPRWFHGMSILLYALLSLLVFRVLSLFVKAGKDDRWWLAVPFIGALLYALHPVHTEAVANIKGRDEILSMLFSLLALYSVWRYAYRKSMVWLLASGIFFFSGLMAKENTITFLAVIPLSLYFFGKPKVKTLVIGMLPALLTTAAYLIIRYNVVGYLMGDIVSDDLMNNPFVDMTPGQKYATIVYTLGLYLKLLFFPHPLTHDYYPYHIPIMEWTKPEVILSLLLYLVMIAAAILGFRRKSMLSFAILYFGATLSIVSNVVFPIGTFMNERFLFMPSLAFCIAVPYYLDRGAKKFGWMRWVGPGLIALYAIGFGFKSATRIPVWKNPMSLNKAGVAVSKNSCRANCFIGTALYTAGQDIADREERYQYMLDAEKYIDRSLEIYPTYYSANQMKSGFIAEHYRYDRDLEKLLSGFETVLIHKPNVPYIPVYCEYLNGRSNIDTDRLMKWYYRVSYDIMLNYHKRADMALNYANYGLSLDPNNAMINLAIGRIYESVGNTAKAQEYFSRAIQLDPSLGGQ
jgi:hypothetical protein